MLETAAAAAVTEAARSAALQEFGGSAAQLAGVIDHLARVASLLAQPSGGEWSGPAHAAFQLALDGVRSSLSLSGALVGSARAEAVHTLRVIASHAG